MEGEEEEEGVDRRPRIEPRRIAGPDSWSQRVFPERFLGRGRVRGFLREVTSRTTMRVLSMFSKLVFYNTHDFKTDDSNVLLIQVDAQSIEPS